MKRIVIIDTTWPINSRTERFRNSLRKCFQIITVSWDRGIKKTIDVENNDDKLYVLKTSIGYGNQIRKLLSLPKFAFHIYNVCKKENPQIIFASHWDSLICAILIKLILRKSKILIVYDCLDMPTHLNRKISKFINFIEKKCLKFVTLTVFASRYFKPLYPLNIKSIIFENYPSSDLFFNTEIVEPEWIKKHHFKLIEKVDNIAWIGVVRYFDVINNILLALRDMSGVYFFIFGDGPDIERVREAVADYNLSDRVIFFGRYGIKDLRYIYKLSTLVWAAYPTKDFNAIYAISNKYFECSLFEKRIILSKKTKMAENIEGNLNVILVDEYSPENIKQNIINNLNLKIEKYCKYEADVLWEEKEDEFIEVIRSLK